MTLTTRLQVAAVFLSTVALQISLGVNAVVFPVTLKSYGYDEAQIGFCLAFEIVAVLLIGRFIPNLVAKAGLMKVFVATSVVRAVVLSLFPHNASLIGWLVGVFIYGMATNVFLISLQTWLNQIVADQARGKVYGLYNAALSIGAASGPILLSMTDFAPANTFYANAALCLFAVLPMLPFLAQIPAIAVQQRPRIRYVFRMAPGVMFSALVGGIAFFGLPTFLTIFGMRSGLSQEHSSYLISAFHCGCIVLGMVASALSDRFPRKTVEICCVAIGLFCALYLPIVIYSYAAALTLLFIWGGAMGGVYAIGLAVIADNFRKEDQVSANVTYGLMDCSGGVLGVYGIGMGMAHMGAGGLSVVIVAAAIVYFVFALSRFEVEALATNL